MKSNIKSRLFIVAGPSQLLFLSAALLKNKEIEKQTYNDILIFRGVNVDSQRRLLCDDIASKIWEWTKVVRLDDISYHNSPDKRKVLKAHFKSVIQIWVCMPYGEVEINLSLVFPSSKIIFFDDGLGSYVVPNTLGDYVNKPSFIKKKLALFLKRNVYAFFNIINLKESGFPSFYHANRYMLFSSFFKNQKNLSQNIIVDWSYLKTQVSKCSIKSNDSLDINDQKVCLILGQYFSLHGELDREEELLHYIKICKKIEANGFRILWKEHPKNPNPFFDNLKQSFNSIENLNDYYSELLPIELLAKNLSVDLYIASTSTSLIILNKVFGSRILSTAPLLVDKMSGADKSVACLLIKELKEEQILKSI
ncbi:polysialyltransferase family glycosyltransferase [Winogradskyella sp. R77965]|uniref:polysialyltransferase family glycosyltransferase n=1 Tax=Winogradskyella sp. R77965 TaxID=3093872 RepID=UPI0037DD3A12